MPMSKIGLNKRSLISVANKFNCHWAWRMAHGAWVILFAPSSFYIPLIYSMPNAQCPMPND
ncbi:hypothetical protein [Nostoc commune]|uniref:hypothetical protein n=1 Tax=Nostoc commune TaxID=1178 RepID=UPI002073F9E6|nr:hypothetical protein [Nostoc commune]